MFGSATDWLGGIFGLASGGMNAAMSWELQKDAQRFAERMAGSQHQRAVADLKKAGLNPILSAKYGGNASPTVGASSYKGMENVALQALQGRDINAATNLKNQTADAAAAQGRSADANARLTNARAAQEEILRPIYEEIGGLVREVTPYISKAVRDYGKGQGKDAAMDAVDKLFEGITNLRGGFDTWKFMPYERMQSHR